MRTPVPPHYLSFRIVLVLVLLAALASTTWWIAHPTVLSEIRHFLGL